MFDRLAFDAFGVLWGVENGADRLKRRDFGGDIHNENPAARRDSAEDFCRLKARRCTAMGSIFIPAYCFAIS